jgi:hypothetical protein
LRVAIWLEYPAESRPLVAALLRWMRARFDVRAELERLSGEQLAPGLRRSRLSLPNDPEAFEALARTLTAIDVSERRRYAYPSIYDARHYLTGRPIYYAAEPRGLEIFACTRALFARGFGDCEDLACDRAADLQLQGYDAWAQLRHEGRGADGTDYWHLLTCTPHGCEDVSALLGMNAWNG